MLKRIFSFTLAIALMLTMTQVSVYASASASRTVEIHSVSGTVSMTRGAEREFSARAGMSLHDGFTVTTGADGSCYLQLDDGSLLKMDVSSRVRVGQTGRNLLSVSVLSGGLAVDAEPQAAGRGVEVRIGNSALAIRGTFFTAENRADGAIIYTMFEGWGDVDGLDLPNRHIMVVWGNEDALFALDLLDTHELIPFDIEYASLFVLELILDDVERFIENGIIEYEEIERVRELYEIRLEERRAQLAESEAAAAAVVAPEFLPQAEADEDDEPGSEDEDSAGEYGTYEQAPYPESEGEGAMTASIIPVRELLGFHGLPADGMFSANYIFPLHYLVAEVYPSGAAGQTATWFMYYSGGTAAEVLPTNSYFLHTNDVPGEIVLGFAFACGYAGVVPLSIHVGGADSSFVPVESITVPGLAQVGVALYLDSVSTVFPHNATYQTIVWSLIDAGGTNAELVGDRLSVTAPGTVGLLATIAGGSAVGDAFTQPVNITFTTGDIPATGVSGTMPTAVAVGGPLAALPTETYPLTATRRDISWEVVAGAGSIDGNMLTATAAGTITVRATVIGGLPEEVFDFSLTAIVPATDVSWTSFDNRAVVGGVIALPMQVIPDNATNQNVIWQGTHPYSPTAPGTVSFVGVIENGGVSNGALADVPISVTVTVYPQITGISGVPTAAAVGVMLPLTGDIVPAGTPVTGGIMWSIWDIGATGAGVLDGEFTASSPGTATVRSQIDQLGNTRTFYHNIRVIRPVTGIPAVPQTAVVGEQLTLPAEAYPLGEGHVVTWSVVDGSAQYLSGNVLTFGSAGTVTLVAAVSDGRVENGALALFESAPITVTGVVPVAGITVQQSATAVNMSMGIVGIVYPPNATFTDITWSIVNAAGTGATIGSTTGTFLAQTVPGTAVVRATIAETGFYQDFNIRVIRPVWGIPTIPSSIAAGGTLVLPSNAEPDYACYSGIVWSLVSATGASFDDDTNTITGITAGGSITMMATVPNGRIVGWQLADLVESNITINVVAAAPVYVCPECGSTVVEADGRVTCTTPETAAAWRIFDCGTLVVDGGTINQYGSGESPWHIHADLINKIIFTDEIIAGTSLQFLFASLEFVTDIEGLYHLDTAAVENMFEMFSRTTRLESLDLSGFNTSNAIGMGGMFESAIGLTSLDLSSFETGNVVSMNNMFFNASNLVNLVLSPNFNTGSVRYMHSMFAGSGFASLDISGFDTGSVIEMGNMFMNMPYLRALTLGENFSFVVGVEAILPDVPYDATYTENWRHVGAGTLDNPQGEVLPAYQFMMTFDGSTMAGTWVWQTRANADAGSTDTNANVPSGNGTTEPFQLSTPEHLSWINGNPSNLSATFVLMGNITAPDDFRIGTQNSIFSGTFIGNGYTITLNSYAPAQDNMGLFSRVSGSVSNLVVDGYVTGRMNVGGIAGAVLPLAMIVNSESRVNVTGVNNVGGLVGINQGEITGSSSRGNVTGVGSGEVVGGLVGFNFAAPSAEILRSFSNSTVSGNNAVGGLVGRNEGFFPIIENVYTTGNVVGSYRVGGIVGDNVGDNSGTGFVAIFSSYALGNVTGNDWVGGIVGHNRNGAEIHNTLALNASISATVGTSVGRIAGNVTAATANNNHARVGSIYPSNPSVPGSVAQGFDINTTSLIDFWDSGLLGWNRTIVWEIRPDGLPILRNAVGEQSPVFTFFPASAPIVDFTFILPELNLLLDEYVYEEYEIEYYYDYYDYYEAKEDEDSDDEYDPDAKEDDSDNEDGLDDIDKGDVKEDDPPVYTPEGEGKDEDSDDDNDNNGPDEEPKTDGGVADDDGYGEYGYPEDYDPDEDVDYSYYSYHSGEVD